MDEELYGNGHEELVAPLWLLFRLVSGILIWPLITKEMHDLWGSIKYEETRTIILHHIPMPVLIIAKNNFCDNPW